MSQDSPVLIVGAGLTGLTAALELARLGVRVRIVDRRPGVTAVPGALIMHARTLDLLDQRGISAEALGARPATEVAVYGHGRPLGTAAFTGCHGARSIMLARRATVERVLREELSGAGVEVEYAAEMIAFRPTGPDADGSGSVRAVLRHSNGRFEELAAEYIVAADGRESLARTVLGLPPQGGCAGPGCLLADLLVAGGPPDDKISVFLGRRGFLMLLPTGGSHFWCVATDPQPRSRDWQAPELAVQQIFDACSPPGRLTGLRWRTRIPGVRSVEPVLQRGRVFFGGDSAYAFWPALGHGMNSGIQDMINLSWKLAMVLHGTAAPDLLATYAPERLQAINEGIHRAGHAADLLGSPGVIRHHLVTRLAPTFIDARFIPRLCADLTEEVVSGYRASPLSAQPRGLGSLQPGLSLPDIPVLASVFGGQPRQVQLRELVMPSRLTLLCAAETLGAPQGCLVKQIAPWQAALRAYQIAPLPGQVEAQLAFRSCFGSGPSLVLVRPDFCVGFAARQQAAEHMFSWLSRWFPVWPGTTCRASGF